MLTAELVYGVHRVQVEREVAGDRVDRDQPPSVRDEHVVTRRRHRQRNRPVRLAVRHAVRERHQGMVLQHGVRGARVVPGDVQVAVVHPSVADEPRHPVRLRPDAAPAVVPRVQLEPGTSPVQPGTSREVPRLAAGGTHRRHRHQRVDAAPAGTRAPDALQRPRERVAPREAPKPIRRRHQDDERASSSDARSYPAHRSIDTTVVVKREDVAAESSRLGEIDQHPASLIGPPRSVLAAPGVDGHLVHAPVGGAHENVPRHPTVARVRPPSQRGDRGVGRRGGFARGPRRHGPGARRRRRGEALKSPPRARVKVSPARVRTVARVPQRHHAVRARGIEPQGGDGDVPGLVLRRGVRGRGRAER